MLLLRDSGADVRDPEALEDTISLAKQLHRLGPGFVLLKGGHLPLTGDHVKPKSSLDACSIVDVLYDGTSVTLFETEFIRSKNTHGTGCSLASAIAANLAGGMDVIRAVRAACRFVEAGIKTAFDLGNGNGPINHFHSIYSLPFAPYVATLYLVSVEISKFCSRLTKRKGADFWNMLWTDRMFSRYGRTSQSMHLWPAFFRRKSSRCT